MPKPEASYGNNESVALHIHPFSRNYTHNLTPNYTFVFTRGYYKTTGAHAHGNTHEPTVAHKRTCRPACKNAEVEARKHMQECIHICAGLHVRAGNMHARADKHTCMQARVDARARTRAYTHAHRHACLLAEPHTHACSGTRARTQILALAHLHMQTCKHA